MKKLLLFSQITFLFLILVICSAIRKNLSALELYQFTNGSCDVQTGLVLNTDQEKVYILGTNGHIQSFDRDNIQNIWVYQTLKHPFSVIANIPVYFINTSGVDVLIVHLVPLVL